MTQRVKRAERRRRQREREDAFSEDAFMRWLLTPTELDIAVERGLELLQKCRESGEGGS